MKFVLTAACSAFILPVAAALHAVEGISPSVYYGAEHAVTVGDKTAELAVIVVHGWGGGAKENNCRALGEDFAKRGAKAYVVTPMFPRRSVLRKAGVAEDGRATCIAAGREPLRALPEFQGVHKGIPRLGGEGDVPRYPRHRPQLGGLPRRLPSRLHRRFALDVLHRKSRQGAFTWRREKGLPEI